jgi:glycosyltransferase involved in cell wall biosynthesis
VLVNSAEMAEVAGRLGATAVQMVGTPIPRPFLDRPVRERQGLERVLYAGRLAPEKNLQTVLDAAAALPQVRFEIGGDGPLRELVEARAHELDNLTVLGWLSRDQVADALDRADMLVLPSKVESFGTIALEAMARGALVLVSSSCGIVRWPSLAKAVFTIQDNETVADAISRITQVDPRLRAEKCRLGSIAARELNESTISGWLDVCTGVCHPEPFEASAAAW